jgi:hypothetical protein
MRIIAIIFPYSDTQIKLKKKHVGVKSYPELKQRGTSKDFLLDQKFKNFSYITPLTKVFRDIIVKSSIYN